MQVDDQFLSAMGLNGLNEEQKQQALDSILYTLNMNVAKRAAELLNEEQLKEFDGLTDGDGNEQELAQWLEKNIPNYQQIVGEEAQKIKDQNDAIVNKVMA
jgi:hypothetical protein